MNLEDIQKEGNYHTKLIFVDNCIEQARALYHDQPYNQLKNKLLENRDALSEKDNSFLTWIDFDQYIIPRNEFVERAATHSIITFAVLKDGKWYERGEMLFFGIVKDEKEDDTWEIEYEQLLKTLPEDTLLTVVDCHI